MSSGRDGERRTTPLLLSAREQTTNDALVGGLERDAGDGPVSRSSASGVEPDLPPHAWGLLVVTALAVGVAARGAFLWWSPLPATLDGFRYARLANHVISTGNLFGSGVESDELITTLVLAVGSEVTGLRPLYLAQPLAAVVGGASVLAGIVLVRGLGRARGWSPRRTFHASVLAALGLAVSGMYLRRTGVPDEETLTLLLLPLFALAAHRALSSRRLAWVALSVALAAVYPPTHNMSALVAAFTLTGVATIHVVEATTRRDVLAALVAAGGFWGYFFGYFAVAEVLGLRLTYSGLLRNHFGALLAWLVVLVVATRWIRSTSKRAVRGLFGVGIGIGFLAAAVNLVTTVFPGTIRTPPLILGLVLLYVVPVGLFAWALPTVVRKGGDAPAVVSLVMGPIALGWFTFSTSLTPEFFGAVMRVQVHAHIAVFVLAAVGAVGIATRHSVSGQAVVGALVLATVFSAPFAFVHIDTATAPRTVHESEFAAVEFASSSGTYASDHRLSRVGPLYYNRGNGTVAPTHAWLDGTAPPACPTLGQRLWTTDGAHFFPAAPKTLSPVRYRNWKATGNLVYSVNGYTESVVVRTLSGRPC